MRWNDKVTWAERNRASFDVPDPLWMAVPNVSRASVLPRTYTSRDLHPRIVPVLSAPVARTVRVDQQSIIPQPRIVPVITKTGHNKPKFQPRAVVWVNVYAEQHKAPESPEAPELIAQPLTLELPVAIEHALVAPPIVRASPSIPIGLSQVPPSPIQKRRWRSHLRSARLDSIVTFLVALGLVATVAATRPGVWALIGVAVVGVSISAWRKANLKALLTSLLAIMVSVTAVDYLSWRVLATNWAGWEIAAPLLLAEIFGALHTLGLQYTIWPREQIAYALDEDPTMRPIFVFIPTVDEGESVLTPTIIGVLEARRRYLDRFPHGHVTIIVCNDGLVANVPNWQDTERLARRLGVACITRRVGGGHKAGNLENARQRSGATGDALIVIFDADQIAHPDFFIKTTAPLTDSSVGWVQTGQYYRNLEQPVARWAHDQQALFYQVLCQGKAAHNAAFICGTNVVIRASALDEIGGLPQDSVTEDFAASITLHQTWRGVFLTEKLAEGLGPMDLPSFLKQQRRWATGTISVLRSHWRDILLPWSGGLNLEQRIQYLLACTHYLCGLRDLIYLVSPILFLVTGIPAVNGATLGQFLLHFIPYWCAAQVAFWFAGRGVTGIRGIIMGFGSFPVLILALLTVILGKRTGFMLTSKQRRGSRSLSHLGVYVWFMVFCVVATGVALLGRHERADSVAISIMWVAYDIALLSSFLWLGLQDLRFEMGAVGSAKSKRVAQRATGLMTERAFALNAITGAAPQIARRRPESTKHHRPLIAIGMIGILLTGILLIHSSTIVDAAPTPFTPTVANASGPLLGLSLPESSLLSSPPALERSLCLPFTIIGRTQTAQDKFDFTWAERLSTQGQQPWITLQFGQFTASGQAPLDASLPAIVNGLQDNNLKRWASDIHNYGKPVYLTVLLHVDRNWAVSSAVAGGGIPQDAPRAWAHIRSIFSAANDVNVAWVWAPADPSQDQAYAPPESEISVVLQSMIHYPDTPWPDPVKVINAVAARHPHKPIILEVSASGDPVQKANWLDQVVASTLTRPVIYALTYHDGSPDVHATPAQNRAWSIESDAKSMSAMSAWQSLVPTNQLPCRRPNAFTASSNGSFVGSGLVVTGAVVALPIDIRRTETAAFKQRRPSESEI